MANFTAGACALGRPHLTPIASSASRQRVEAPVTAKAYAICAFTAFGGVLFGYDSGYISGVLGMDSFKRNYGRPSTIDFSGYAYQTWEKSLTVAILSIGTFIGALVSGWSADLIGRKSTLIGPGCGVFTVGVIVQMAATHISGFCSGRFIAGLGVGCLSAVSIIYMSEVAPRKVRGAIVSLYQFAITIGLMLASCVGYATRNLEGSAAYRIPIGIQFLWAAILSIGLTLLPESPRYYVKKGRLDKAAKALARVRGQPVSSTCIEDELAEIVASHEFERQAGKVSWLGIFSGGISRPNSNLRKIFIGTTLQMMQVSLKFFFKRNMFRNSRAINSHPISRPFRPLLHSYTIPYIYRLTFHVAMDWYQLHLLLQRHLLPVHPREQRLLSIHDHNDSQRRQHADFLLGD